MNPRARQWFRRDAFDESRAGKPERVRRRGTTWLASMLLLWLPAAAAVAQESCDPLDDEMDWFLAKNADSTEKYLEYMRKCPDGAYAEEARFLVDYQVVRACTDLAAVRGFRNRDDLDRLLTKDKKKDLNECINRLEQAKLLVDYRVVRACTDRAAVQDFQRTYGDDPLVTEDMNREMNECIARLKIRDEIEDLLRTCRNHFEQGRITSGFVDNALDCYRRVLELDDRNVEAWEGVSRILELLVNEANQAIEEKDVNKADSAIEELRRVSPRHPQLPDLYQRLASLRESLEQQEELQRLERKVRDLLRDGEYKQVIAEVERARARRLTSDELDRLETEAKNALEAKEIEERRKRQQKALAEARERREKRDFDGARAKLLESKNLGLPEKEYKRELDAIEEAERRFGVARQVETLLAECRGHEQEGRLEEALACYREVQDLDKDNFEAQTEIPRLEAAIRIRKVEALLAECRSYRWRQVGESAQPRRRR